MKNVKSTHCDHECVCPSYWPQNERGKGPCGFDTKCPKGCDTRLKQPAPSSVVYSHVISVPSKAFPSIKRKKLAINDIGDEQDGFTRLNFELQDGDEIQVIRKERDRQ